MKVRTRFAPSPTGYLHIGSARTALFNWLYAKGHDGEFILRIEDTDRARSKPEFTQDILNSLSWLELNSDIDPVYQSKRTTRYQQIIRQLLDEGNAYHCYCSKDRLEELREQQIKNKHKPKYDGFCRNRRQPTSQDVRPVVRFKNPIDGLVEIVDQVQGRVEVQNSELDDLILARSDGTPTFHLCVVADDMDFDISHVIRGDDHLNNTSRQVNIFKALNKEPPVYAHIPLIHGKDGKRLSKRHGAVSVHQYRQNGILPQSLLNYLVRLGWSHGDQEIFTIKQMIELFNLNSVQKSAATFDYEKLLWVNQQHMKSTTGASMRAILEEYFKSNGVLLAEEPDIAEIYDLQKDRCKSLKEICETSMYFYNDIDNYEEEAAKKYFATNSIEILRNLKNCLQTLDSWSAENIHAAVKSVADDLNLNFGNVAPTLRLAVTGQAKSPSIDVTLKHIGQEKSLHRIDRAIAYIGTTV